MKSVLLACGLLTVTTPAPTDPPKGIKDSFTRIDENSDHQLTLAELLKIYDSYDTNGDGHMDLKEYMATTTVPKEMATANFNYYDKDKDGDISRAEVQKIFANFDANGTGTISLGEFTHHLSVIQSAMSAAVGR